jgi:hypothetical protein
MKFFKKILKNPFKKKTTTSKNPTVIFEKPKQKFGLKQKKILKNIAKRTFRKNAPINWLGALTKVSKWIWLSIFIGLFLASAYLTFFTEIFYIKKILIYEGAKESNNLSIRKIVEPLRNRNLFLFSTDELKNTITERVDNLSNLQVQRKIPNTLIVKFENFKNVANITNIIGKLEVKKSFIINENGLLIAEDKISTTLPNISIKSEKAYNIGDQILKVENLKYILEAKKQFEEKFKIKVTETKFLPNPKEVRFVTEKGFEVWLDLLVPYSEQLMKLKNSIPKIDLYSGNLQYVDLRIQSAEGQKIIYK